MITSREEEEKENEINQANDKQGEEPGYSWIECENTGGAFNC